MAFGNGHYGEARQVGSVVDPRVHEVVQAAQEELEQLIRQRAEVVKRIGTMKQTLAGLARLFGEEVLSDEVRRMLHRKVSARGAGLTDTCRLVLMEADRPLSARELCDRLEARIGAVMSRHKDRMASVTTVLNRLVHYGEARALVYAGRRAWQWASEAEDHVVGSATFPTGMMTPVIPRHEVPQRQAK
jgi:hypothetical protein